MKREFQQLKIQCWEHPERIGTCQPSLCIQADTDAGKVVLEAIGELMAEGPPASRTLTTLPNIRKNSITTIRISLRPESEELKQMSLTRDGTVATLQFTVEGLEQFRAAVVAWLDGAEDFCLSPHGSRKARHRKTRTKLGQKDLASGELWFWTPRMDP